MAFDLIGIGAAPNDGTGDPLRTAFGKFNDLATALNAAGWGASGGPRPVVDYATATALAANSYAAGVITASANGALSIDGASPAAGKRILVKDEGGGSSLKNGIYTVTSAGSGGTPWVLTRAADYDSWGELFACIIAVQLGTANAETLWQATADDGGTLGATAIAFVQAGAGSINATKWGYLAAATAFGGPLIGVANLAGLVTAGGGAAAWLSALGALASSSYTAADVLAKLLTVDGASSGLDADLLDAQSGAYYLAFGNFTGTLASGQFADNTIAPARLAFSATARIAVRKTASAGGGEEGTASEVLDFIGSTRGSVLYRGAAGWAILAPGTSGHFLKSNGAGADPSYAAASTSLADADYGDVVLTGSGTIWTLDTTAISGKTTDSAPDHAADYVLTHDVSAAALKKVLLKLLGAGRQGEFIDAAALKPRVSNGCAALATVETTTNKVALETLDFDATSIEYCQWRRFFTTQLGTTQITFVPIWKHASTSTNFGVTWKLRAQGLSNDDAADTAFGTAVASTDTGGTTNDIYVGPESAAITIANLAAGDHVFFELFRDPTDGSDTMAIDAGLLGVVIYYTTIQNTD